MYAEFVVGILEKSLGARKDELAIFKRTIDSNNFIGTPELKDTAALYKSIEAALLAIQVPTEAGQAHLTLVNSIGTLANVTGAMGVWGGDPVAGLAYMDAFLKAEYDVREDMTNLFTLISDLLNK